jgi:hypothetical protein
MKVAYPIGRYRAVFRRSGVKSRPSGIRVRETLVSIFLSDRFGITFRSLAAFTFGDGLVPEAVSNSG